MIARLPLYDRLRVMRRSALSQLVEADSLDGGLLRVASDAHIALDALAAEDSATTEPGARAVLLDNNLNITLAIYTADRQSAAAVLSPIAAVRLAGRLIAAAVPKL